MTYHLDMRLRLLLLSHMPYHLAPLDLAFHALSDPTRRAVLSRLVEGETPVSVLAEPFDMSLQTFSQHLKVLEQCGLVATEKRGRTRWCRLVEARFEEAADWMETERRRWAERLDRLDAYLDTTQKE
jgi:DNA-binding transcriptional ArsR family regulator